MSSEEMEVFDSACESSPQELAPEKKTRTNVERVAQEPPGFGADAFGDEEERVNKKLKEQEANAILRERFLRFLSKMSGKQVQIHLFEKMCLQGKFIAMQMNHQHYLVDQLQTPTGVVEHAALRMNDTVSISVPLSEFGEEDLSS